VRSWNTGDGAPQKRRFLVFLQDGAARKGMPMLTTFCARVSISPRVVWERSPSALFTTRVLRRFGRILDCAVETLIVQQGGVGRPRQWRVGLGQQ